MRDDVETGINDLPALEKAEASEYLLSSAVYCGTYKESFAISQWRLATLSPRFSN